MNESSLQSQFMKEAESMIQLNHQHIIKLYGISIGTPLMIVGPMCPLLIIIIIVINNSYYIVD